MTPSTIRLAGALALCTGLVACTTVPGAPYYEAPYYPVYQPQPVYMYNQPPLVRPYPVAPPPPIYYGRPYDDDRRGWNHPPGGHDRWRDRDNGRDRDNARDRDRADRDRRDREDRERHDRDAQRGRPRNAFSRHRRRLHKARTGCGAMHAPLAKVSPPTTIEAEAPGLQTQQTAERLHRPTYTEPCHALPPEAPVEMARRSGALRLQRPACVQPGHSLH